MVHMDHNRSKYLKNVNVANSSYREKIMVHKGLLEIW